MQAERGHHLLLRGLLGELLGGLQVGGGVHPTAERAGVGLRRAAGRGAVPLRGEDQDHLQHVHGRQQPQPRLLGRLEHPALLPHALHAAAETETHRVLPGHTRYFV